MKEMIRNEIETLNKALSIAANARYLRFESFTRALEAVGFPYQLVQGYSRTLGNVYSWTGTWDKGSVFVNETIAGRKAVRGIANAVNALRGVLESFAA